MTRDSTARSSIGLGAVRRRYRSGRTRFRRRADGAKLSAGMRSWWVILVWAWHGLLLPLASTLAEASAAPATVEQEATSDVPSASVASGGAAGAFDDGSSAADVESPAIVALRQQAAAVRALLAGQLEGGVDPSTLFDVPLGDRDSVRVEAERLRAIVGAASSEAPPTEVAAGGAGHSPDAGAPSGDGGASNGDAGLQSAVVVRDGGAREMEPLPLDAVRWRAQLELDRARLAFLDLTEPRRRELLALHAERQRATADAAENRELSAAERAAREAGLERQRALSAARQARTEAARLVAEERARLLAVIKKQAEYDAALARRQLLLASAREEWLKLRREVREALAATARGELGRHEIDLLYDRLRERLTSARKALSGATSRVVSTASAVPLPGGERLGNLPAEVDTSAVKSLDVRARDAAERLVEAEHELELREAEQLYHQVHTLNEDRLSLLPHLSREKREAVAGFGRAGLDQAAAELRQVVLVLRYHFMATLNWVADLADTHSARGKAALNAVLLAIRAVPPLIVFLWWRRRAHGILSGLHEELLSESMRRMTRPAGGGPAVRVVSLLLRTHRPLEWLLLILAIKWLLPTETTTLLELTLPMTILSWVLGGTLVVLVIDYFAGEEQARNRGPRKLDRSRIRLRSLRTVGRVVVGFGLVLDLTSQIVGRGTVFAWVWRLCWLAAVPLALVLVRWWRGVIFERVDRKRKKSPVERWVVANRSGWQSFVAAVVGGGLLVWQGTQRSLRSWIGGFNLTRRILAYLFRREISKKAEAGAEPALGPLGPEVYVALSPGTPSLTLVPSVADPLLAQVIARIKAPGGGVFAVVGERGLGKTTMLRRIAEEAPNVISLHCPFGGMEAFTPAFLSALNAPVDASLESVASSFDDLASDEPGILVDDAHRLILPMMGGLKSFDRVLAIARQHSKKVAWVFAFDDVIWRFFERIRGAQPLFDEVVRLRPWQEDGIARLLVERSLGAGVEPRFDHLVSELPSDADEIDLQEARDRTEASYYRLIWDYAGGNPGVALHVWRSLLGADAHGGFAVKVFQAPRTDALERLPDQAVFVLRALVQMERAKPAAISRATGISLDQVEDALRFGSVRGYLRYDESGYTVHWSWFRVITRFLQRRHLLFVE